MVQTLLTVPPALADFVSTIQPLQYSWQRRLGAGSSAAHITSDPRGVRLGSGGGTVNVLYQAWRGEKNAASLHDWLGDRQRLILHSGGESRRLPAYAAIGKAFLPVPHLEGLATSIHDQRLADFQLPAYRETLLEAGSKAAAMVTSGDVWLDFDPTEIPAVQSDIAGIGMQVTPEIAQHFGVFFVEKGARDRQTVERAISFFLQKPSAAEIRRLSLRFDFFVDTGMWLLSAEALKVLFQRCGANLSSGRFETPNGLPLPLDLYTEVGAALGAKATTPAALKRAGFRRLTSSVIPLYSARFYHLGSTRQLLESAEQIQWQAVAPTKSFRIASPAAWEAGKKDQGSNWVEGCLAERLPELRGSNVLTGLPRGARLSSIPPEICVDVSPIGESDYVLRVYHCDDTLRGAPAKATICGQAVLPWLQRRNLPSSTGDVFDLPVYPIVKAHEIDDRAIRWFCHENTNDAEPSRFAGRELLSASQIPERINFERYFAERRDGVEESVRRSLEEIVDRAQSSVLTWDCAELADFCLHESPALKKWILKNRERILGATLRPELQARFLMLLSQLSEGRAADVFKQDSFQTLQKALVSTHHLAPSQPKMTLKEDQIVWARSPVRLDLAGGWTDTPPYCLEAGGAVLNVAVLLNRQPPIQTFIRRTNTPTIQLRSIDQGSEETVKDFKALADFRNPKGNFSLPKAALALAGFLPEFSGGRASKTLRAQLESLGGGMEISLLSAVPKGSGLGTSSILGATLLGAINRACGLNWNDVDLYNRVLGVEQLLTTGGGWQDQAGALFPSVKLVETRPGLTQSPIVRYLSPGVFDESVLNRKIHLYYTGATRMAKGILQEIVRDMFLGRSQTLRTLSHIRSNAWQAFHAAQLHDLPRVERCIARSWRLNRALDAGTTTPEIEGILRVCGDDLAACKLLGAGGGGYMLLCAKDAEAGTRLRDRLEKNPPNQKARFIDFAISPTGLEVTVS